LFNNYSTDAINTRTACDFWKEVAYVVTKLTPLEDSTSTGVGLQAQELPTQRLGQP